MPEDGVGLVYVFGSDIYRCVCVCVPSVACMCVACVVWCAFKFGVCSV